MKIATYISYFLIIFSLLVSCKTENKDDSMTTTLLLLSTLPKSASKPASITYSLYQERYTGVSTGTSIYSSPLISAPIVANSNTTIKSFSITPTLPNGLSLNTSSGLLSGTLASYPASKAYQFKVTVEFTPNAGYTLSQTTTTSRDILFYFDSVAGIDNVKCKFVGTPGGCPSSTIGYTCDASAQCSNVSTCSNLADCYLY